MAKQIVLVIDDTALNIAKLSKILSPEYVVKAARSGEEGLELAKKYLPDLILLDIVMTGISGYEVLERLKAEKLTRAIPVIFVTSMTETRDEEKGLLAGAVDYIAKPFVGTIVKLRVRTHMRIIEQMKIIEQYGLLDPLTELPNRRSFDQRCESEWSKAVRNCDPIGMAMLDIDKFKLFNDNYGHANGDVVLKEIAKIMKAVLRRGSDGAFRWGGEEFAMLFPSTGTRGAYEIAELVRAAIAGARVALLDGREVGVTASIGVGSLVPVIGSSAQDFLIEVDDALYRAKKNGRNRVEMVEVGGVG